ncbi:cysteine hydrolase family protein [Brucella pseudogrignonensis]|jgi:nicotinamidase-related amidase|uniref:cysteine hydrolase family protein n=1 Tax=Brucella pseudogrignonensis TaxID=419475 RepID=UPI0002BBD7E9|nr:isochorismatase family cysteine hydrolase [Brucella pseudogrignonensis]EMG51540.1 isochorismatase hydrolase [Ochrobactrum sp. CDB2]MBO1026630.1 cysteine hydrolase [Ochrobactrum sp. SD129]MQP40243.1 isochorismatase family protein [Ochrobactrum sp. MYb237]PQZ39324.1 cysteine hydrolase [Brucella pseudogrignonensis]PRA41173.1 cysteine hydrolase [Brucella pseudogrignonensis]
MLPETGITKGTLRAGSMHLCIDMQKLFGPGAPWHVPWAEAVLPNIIRACEIFGERTIFTRFIPPQSPDDAIGAWKRYYYKWQNVTLERLDRDLLNLVDPLQRFVPPATILDKAVYSPWTQGLLQKLLYKKRVHTLIVTGAETDLCVLATLLGAVDRGYRVILVTDAVCSTSDASHDAILALCHQRLAEQLELTTTQQLIDAW